MVKCELCNRPPVQFLIPIEELVDLFPPDARCEEHRDLTLGRPKTIWRTETFTEEDYQVAYVRYIMES